MIIKKKLLSFLNSTSKIKNIKNKYDKFNGPVLILGDGVSLLSVKKYLNKYKYIISCNSTVLYEPLKNHNILFWIVREPNWMYRQIFMKKKKDIHRLINDKNKIKNFNNYSKAFMIAHPIGRLFNYFFHKIKNVIYLSPYYEIKLKNRKIYNDFTAAFQTCVGTALLAGFKEIHFCGFDAWLLAPKNSIRWFSNCQNPKKYDYKNNLTNKIPLFLKLASEVAKLKVYTFNHYKSKYKVINSIKIKNKVKYNNRKNSMNKHSLNIWSNYENIRFPNGYNVKNQE